LESVNHVTGLNCQPCDRFGPRAIAPSRSRLGLGTFRGHG